MGSKSQCLSCEWELSTGNTIDGSQPKTVWALEVGTTEASIRRHLKPGHRAKVGVTRGTGADVAQMRHVDEASTSGARSTEFMRTRPVTFEDAREWVRGSGDDPEDYDISIRSIAYGEGMWSNRMAATPKRKKQGAVDSDTQPAWPVIQPARSVTITYSDSIPAPARAEGVKLSLKCADTQIGFRAVEHGYEEFHDLKAMNVFTKVVRAEQPDSVVILGDFIDLPGQSRWAQEPGFARTTQMSIDLAHEWLAALRAAAPKAKIVLVEGNHDKRLETYAMTNALASFGLKQANKPDSWPTLSLPFLLRLDELGVEYQDAYPTAVYWDDDNTRNIHGTRSNSKGSTTSQYSQELPHISTWVGHTHRAEVTFKTVMGARGEAIESYTANPGCLCKTDGTVPGVHGALHSDGSSARIVEDWQNGFGSLLYSEGGQSWPQVHRIRDGVTVYNGKRYAV